MVRPCRKKIPGSNFDSQVVNVMMRKRQIFLKEMMEGGREGRGKKSLYFTHLFLDSIELS